MLNRRQENEDRGMYRPPIDDDQMSRGIIVVGYGKLPQGTSAEALHKILAIAVLVDKESGLILDASSTLLTPVGDRFVCYHLIGLNLISDCPRFIDVISSRYLGHAQKAVIAAFRDLGRNFAEALEKAP